MNARRDEQRRETEAKVLSAAGELFRTRGFANTTIRDIAVACGVSVGTVASVGEKDALLVAVFDRGIKGIHEANFRGAEGVRGDLTEQILLLLDPFIEMFTADAALARAYGSVLVAGEHGSIVFSDLSGLLVGEIETAVLGAEDPPAAEQARSLAESIYFAYIGRLFSWPSDAATSAADLRRSLRRIVAAICRAGEAWA